MMFKWITNALKGITLARMQGKFPFNNKGFALNEGETPEQGFARVEGELATAKAAGGKGFYDSLSADIKTNPSMMKFEKSSHEDIAKSYINLQSKIGAKGVIIPGEGASEDDVSKFQIATGRPEKIEGYTFPAIEGLHKGAVEDLGILKEFGNIAFKLGLSNKQAQELRAWQMTGMSNSIKQAEEATTKGINEAKTAMSQKYGAQADAKIALAANIINKFGGEKAQAFLDAGMGNDPGMIEMLVNIGEQLSEDALGPGGKSGLGGLTPALAQEKITATLGNPKHPYNDENNPMHKEAVEEMTSLYRIVEGV